MSTSGWPAGARIDRLDEAIARISPGETVVAAGVKMLRDQGYDPLQVWCQLHAAGAHLLLLEQFDVGTEMTPEHDITTLIWIEVNHASAS